MSRILLLTNTAVGNAGGRALLCKLNRDILLEIFGTDLMVLELPPWPVRSMADMAKAFRGHISGVNSGVLKSIRQLIAQNEVVQVFIDGSNLGELARAIKRSFADVEVVTFFHNVEARFFLGALRHVPNIRGGAVMVANYLAERKSVRYSDKLICLSERDSRLLRKLYGRAATHISPMALRDSSTGVHHSEQPRSEQFALFVGGVFYANQAGITWYARHVAAHVPMKTCVVGHGFEALKQELEHCGRIDVVGSVPSLAQWYRQAHVVIAPIFDGSGMKTKVAEALMFGKYVIGTPEAFSGYEDLPDHAGIVCNSAADFVAALNRSFEAPYHAMDPRLRAVYEQRYSYAAACKRMRQIMRRGSLSHSENSRVATTA